MSEILYYAAQQEAIRLGARLTDVIARIDHPQAAVLTSRVITKAHERPRLVFTGQYSSGKSTLIKALSDGKANVTIGSDITTDKVTEYDWDGLLELVDTPGVQAGLLEHDLLAEEAISAADLVLFAVTVDLFDDAGIKHLHHVAATLGKRDQLLLVITKANSMRAEPGVRQAAVRDALGSLSDAIPFIECDAGDYLMGLESADPVRRAAYQEISNLAALRAAINDISTRRGDLARFRQPFQVIKAVALEAEALLTEDPDEEAALTLLARQRNALTTRVQRIDAKLDELASAFRTDSVRAAESFADDVEFIDSMPAGAARDKRIEKFTVDLNDNLNRAADRLGAGIARILEMQFDDLAAEVREIEAAPHTRVVLTLAHEAEIASPRPDVRVKDQPGRAARPPAFIPPWAGRAGRWLKEFQATWGAGGGVKASAGSVGHKVVLNTGHLLGKQFKPWQAVRAADRIGKAAKVGGAVLTVGVELVSVIAEERAEVRAQEERSRRRHHLVKEVLQQAEEISRQAIQEVRLQLDSLFSDAYAEIDAVHGEIIRARGRRTTQSDELAEIQADAEAALTRLATDSAAGS